MKYNINDSKANKDFCKKDGLRLMAGLLTLMLVFVLSACKISDGVKDKNGKEDVVSGPEEIAETYIQAELKGDVDKYISTMPGKYKDYVVAEYFEGDEDAFLEELENGLLASYLKQNELEESDVEYKINDAEEMSDDAKTEVDNLFADNDLGTIDDRKDVRMNITINYDDDSEEIILVLHMVKMGDKWYIAARETE